MKRFLGLTVVVILMGAITLTAQEKKDAPAPKDVPPAGTEDFYPLKKDATWTYDVGGSEIIVKCVAQETAGDLAGCWKLETTANNKVSATEHVKIEKDGIYRYAVNGTKPDAPIKFFAFPAEDKTTWALDTKVQGQEVKGTFIVKKEDITIGTTAYPKSTLVESTNLKIGGMDTSIKQWFAPNVGIVKLDFKLGGQDAVLTLKKFEPGK